MNIMKNFLYILCGLSMSTVYANPDKHPDHNTLEVIELREQNEKLLKENAELLVDKEELESEINHLKNKNTKCIESKASVSHVPQASATVQVEEPVHKKLSYLERAKNKINHLVDRAKNMF